MGLAKPLGMAMIAGMPPLRLAIAGCGSRVRTCARLAAHLQPRYHGLMAFAAELFHWQGGRRIQSWEVRG